MSARRKSGVAFAVTLLALVVIFLGLSFIVLNGIAGRASSAEHALVIDAGSSGSRIHLYKWVPEDGARIPVITEARLDKDCRRVDGGLSKLGGNDDTDETASRVHDSLALLITCAKLGLTDRVANFQKIPLYLRATAGMRILRRKDKDRYDKVMEEVLAYLSSTPFHFRGARVIEGQEEALYAWVAANYLNGSLGEASEKRTIGILELGGASAQIAFVPQDPKPEDTEVVKIGEREYREYRVYARGYDGVGKSRFIEAFEGGDSCYLGNDEATGEGLSAGDYNACKKQIIDHFDKTENIVFKQLKEANPPAYDGKYLALSNFYHTPNFFWQKYNRKFSELEIAGIEYCRKSWEVIRAENTGVSEKFLREYCLMAAYIPVLLTTEGFRVEDDKGRVMLRLEGSEADVEWTLGALICSLYECGSGS